MGFAGNRPDRFQKLVRFQPDVVVPAINNLELGVKDLWFQHGLDILTNFRSVFIKVPCPD